jgi:hypothetical protein
MQDEFTILKQALKTFENKNYKKSVKLCEEGLRSYPHSSELLSLKAICFHSLGKNSEGYDLVKKSLQQNTKSGLSWHLYAIMLKNDKNFIDSIKSMRTSLKFDESNISLRKEMSTLMLICQDFESFLEARTIIFSSNNSSIINISSMALAFLLNQFFLSYLVFVKYLILLVGNSASVSGNLLDAFLKCCSSSFISSLSSSSKYPVTISSLPRDFPFRPRDFNEIYSISKQFYCKNDCYNALNILFSLGKFNPFHERNLAYLECLIHLKIAQKDRNNIEIAVGKIISLFKIDDTSKLPDLIEKLKYFQSLELLYKLSLAHYFCLEFKLALEIVNVSISVLEEMSIDFLEFINYSFKRCAFRNFSELLAMNNTLLRFSHSQDSMILMFKLYLIKFWKGESVNQVDFANMLKMARKFCWNDQRTLSLFYVICIYEKRDIFIEKIYLRLCHLGFRPCFKGEKKENLGFKGYVFTSSRKSINLEYSLYLNSDFILNPTEYIEFIRSIIDSSEKCKISEENNLQIKNILDKSSQTTDFLRP